MNEYEIIVKSDAVYLDACALMKIVNEEGDSSRFVRLMVYGSDLKIFASWIAFGEFIGIFNKRMMQEKIGLGNYLYNCRSIMKDFEYNKLIRIEPSDDSLRFSQLVNYFLNRHSKLGGADIWHLLAAAELKQSYNLSLLFSYDRDLVKAANSENIAAVDGNNLIPELLMESLELSNRWIPFK